MKKTPTEFDEIYEIVEKIKKRVKDLINEDSSIQLKWINDDIDKWSSDLVELAVELEKKAYKND